MNLEAYNGEQGAGFPLRQNFHQSSLFARVVYLEGL